MSKHRWLIGTLAGALALLALPGCQGARAGSACIPGDPKLVGHYYLNGVMEVGSELLLKPDGSFEFGLAYGALDQYGKGCWRVEGDKVLVIPEGRGAPAPISTPWTTAASSASRSPSTAATSSGTSATATRAVSRRVDRANWSRRRRAR